MPFVSSDPNAWMRPYYAAIASRDGFAHLAIPLQFAALISAIEPDHPSKAAWLRDIRDLPSQRALLGSLANVAYSTPPPSAMELWQARKDARTLRCVAVYLPTGIDLRLMDGEDFRRTELLKGGPAVQARAAAWRQMLTESGWLISEAPDPTCHG